MVEYAKIKETKYVIALDFDDEIKYIKIKMNHQKIYNDIIDRSKSLNRIKVLKSNTSYVYYERHHILPKCLGGSNDTTNLILLTAKEHYLCHKLLVCIYPTNRKLALALMRMSGNEKYQISLRSYETAKDYLNSIPMSNETRDKIRKSIVGIKHPQWRNDQKSIYQKGLTHKKYSDESKKHCSDGQKKLYANGYQSNFTKLKGKPSWNSGNTKCRTWMYNESLNKSKQIPNEMVQEFLKNNWKVGRLIK